MHGIVVGGWIEHPTHEGFPHTSIKRTGGAHRIASYLREQGWDIEVLDYLPAWSIEELKEFCRLRIRKDTVFFGISTVFSLAKAEYHIIDFLNWFKEKYPHIPTIAGSKQLMANHNLPADYHLAGYGEYAIVELLKKLTGNSHNAVIENFDMMGKTYNFINCDSSHPAFPMNDLQVKYEKRDFIESNENLTLELTRGCKFKCKFCSFNIIGYRGDASRCMNNLHEELLRNYDMWGVTDYSCADETTNADANVLMKTADAIRNLPFKVNMQGYVRGDLIAARPQDWEHIADMGLWGHYYGIESFNYESAKSIGKGMHPEKLKQGLLDAQDYFLKRLGKFRTTFSFIIGLPCETEETFNDGIDWMFSNMKTPSLNMFPLTIQHSISDSKLKNSYSEFDLTWDKSGLFTETTLDKMGASREKLGSDANWERLTRNDITKWSHDTMNIWEAYKIYTKYQADTNFWEKQYPNIWFFHRYMNAGCNYDDLHKPLNKLSGVKLGIDAAIKKVNDYKEKKLNL